MYKDISNKTANANVYVNELLMAQIEVLEDKVGRLTVELCKRDREIEVLTMDMQEQWIN